MDVKKHVGVSFHKRIQKWTANISIKGKLVNLGSFIEYDDAVKARQEAELSFKDGTFVIVSNNKVASINDITWETVNALLAYNQDTGSIVWRRGSKVGQEAGVTTTGSRVINICGKPIRAHYIATMLVLTEWPEGKVQHYNKNRLDNRWINIDHPMNREECISWCMEREQWRAKGLSQQDLGYFNSKEEASEARANSRVKVYGTVENTKDITWEMVDELLEYKPFTGRFYWKSDRRGSTKAGDMAGCVNTHGYRAIKLYGKNICESRLALFITEGTWPPEMVDHISRTRDDNRLSNLRHATPLQNAWNKEPSANNTSGKAGVYCAKATGKWIATIRRDGKLRHLGTFDTFEEARDCRLQAEKELGISDWIPSSDI